MLLIRDMARRYNGHLENPHYRGYKRYLQSEWVECHEDGCTNRATLGDHVPPISSFPDPRDWTGVLLPHCKPCSNRQGAKLRWARNTPKPSREW